MSFQFPSHVLPFISASSPFAFHLFSFSFISFAFPSCSLSIVFLLLSMLRHSICNSISLFFLPFIPCFAFQFEFHTSFPITFQCLSISFLFPSCLNSMSLFLFIDSIPFHCPSIPFHSVRVPPHSFDCSVFLPTFFSNSNVPLVS